MLAAGLVIQRWNLVVRYFCGLRQVSLPDQLLDGSHTIVATHWSRCSDELTTRTTALGESGRFRKQRTLNRPFRGIRTGISKRLLLCSVFIFFSTVNTFVLLPWCWKTRQIFPIGTVRCAEGLWRMRRHGPVIAHCTDSEDFPKDYSKAIKSTHIAYVYGTLVFYCRFYLMRMGMALSYRTSWVT